MGDASTYVVVGGGVAGLLAARRLARAGAQVTVLEASDRWGGRVSSVELDGLVLDAGAESFATRGNVMADLAAELGLTEDLITPTRTPAWVVSAERAYPLPATGWLGVPAQPFAREVRRILGWRGALRTLRDRWRPLREVPADITVGALVRDRLGDAVADRLVAPVIAGVYSRDIDSLPLVSIAPALPREVQAAGGVLKAAAGRRKAAPAGSAVQGIVGGIARLTDALVEQCAAAGAVLVAQAPCETITRSGTGWRVTTAGTAYDADAVVIAVPLPTARQWLPELPPADAKHVALVTLVLDAPELDAAPRGTGVLTIGAVTRAKALTHSTAKWPWLAERAQGRHVVRLSYAIESTQESVISHALGDAARLLGVRLEPSQVRASAQVIWPDANPVDMTGVRLPDGVELVGSAAGLSGLAAIVAADVRAR